MPTVVESRGYRNGGTTGTIENSLDRSQELTARKKKTVKIKAQKTIGRIPENVQLSKIIELHNAELKLLQAMQLSLMAIQKGIAIRGKNIFNAV